MSRAKFIGISLALLGFIFIGLQYRAVWQNKPAYNAKIKIARELSKLNEKEFIEHDFSQVGGAKWDYICYVGYYSEGIDSAKRSLKEVNLSNWLIEDEYFSDAETGLVFLSLKDQILVSVRIDVAVDEKRSENNFCI